MKATLHLPRADPLLLRWARNTLVRTLGPYSGKRPAEKALHLAGYVLRHPLLTALGLREHANRLRCDGKVLPDVMMVELTAAPRE